MPPAPPPVVLPGTGNNIIINPLQRGNLLLDCIRNVGKQFGDIVADYQVGRTTGALFLSLKYHRLHPEYIHIRIEKLGSAYSLRILLILCDITEHRDPIRELTKTCLINNITVLVAFSFEEAGHYLSTLKQFEHKPPNLIKERVDKDYNSILRTALTSISKINKTDVETLRTSFGSFSRIAKATPDQLQNLPGFGQVKVKNIKNAFDKPMRNNAIRTLDHGTSQTPGPSPDSHGRPMSLSRNRIERSPNPLLYPPPRDPSSLRDIVLEPDSPEITAPSNSTAEARSTGKGKEKEKSTSEPRPPREPSPVWDIELDLDSPTADVEPPSKASHPVFDIELDLN